MIKVLDHGFVDLLETMPGRNDYQIARGDTIDDAVVQAARVSVGGEPSKDPRGLIRYLMRNKHTSPFEMIEFKFLCKMPIFVARQWVRHRTANVNEISARYSELSDEFYIPEHFTKQSSNNQQGGEEPLNDIDNNHLQGTLDVHCENSFGEYQNALRQGVARELARLFLPVNFYTQWIWKIDLHNLFHFLKLRMDSHAQEEIRVYAEAMYQLIKPLVPICCEAWEDYIRDSMTLSRLEVFKLKELIRAGIWDNSVSLGSGNKREDQEFFEKIQRLTNV